MCAASSIDVLHQHPAPYTWDFFTGRGDGATRSDRAAVRWQFAARVLGATLARDAGFNRLADELARAVNGYGVAVVASPVDVLRVRSLHLPLARRYWPRAGERQAVMARLLWVAASHRDQRTDRLANAGRPVAYFPDGPPSGPHAGYAVRRDHERTVMHGAVLVARRGAGRCLGCDEPLEQVREPVYGPWRQTTRRIDYCPDCTADSDHLHAMADVLRDAAAFILR